ncbi:MAG: response regulator [Planctomycetales bacterium]|nr:response regulator [Planctomycetales bacterium]
MKNSVLVVDGEPALRSEMVSILENAGFEALGAENGLRGLELIERENVRLVICDWHVDDASGIDLCCKLKTAGLGSYVYVILLTPKDSIDQRVQGMVAGADDIVSKPFQPSDLVARVKVGYRLLQLETRESLILSLAKLAERREPETGHHIERVQCYSRCLAEQLQGHPKYSGIVTSEYVQLIYQTSPLHDIGKIGIPESVLLKPGKLTQREFDLVKEHPLIGAETLRGAIERGPETPFLEMAHDIALSHHEKFDGSGYPQGLAGEAIPLAARIVALADVYDALTTHRVYKDAYSHEKSESIIVEDRGRHFDPDVVDAFLQVKETFQAICRHFDNDGNDLPRGGANQTTEPVLSESNDYLGPYETASLT